MGAAGPIVEFTIELDGRPSHKTPLTEAEASAMAGLGFRFSIFRPDENQFQISLPYTAVIDVERGRVTFRQ